MQIKSAAKCSMVVMNDTMLSTRSVWLKMKCKMYDVTTITKAVQLMTHATKGIQITSLTAQK
jgi:hypothetical protein